MTADLSRAPKWRPGSGGDSSVTGIYFEAGLKGQVCVCLRIGVCVCVCVRTRGGAGGADTSDFATSPM